MTYKIATRLVFYVSHSSFHRIIIIYVILLLTFCAINLRDVTKRQTQNKNYCFEFRCKIYCSNFTYAPFINNVLVLYLSFYKVLVFKQNSSVKLKTIKNNSVKLKQQTFKIFSLVLIKFNFNFQNKL